MKVALPIIAAVLTGSLMFASGAQAETCTITGTGPDSTNECSVRDRENCTITNSTDGTVDNGNTQTSGSGNGSTTGNTTGGGATTGGTSNGNSTGVDLSVTNGNDCVAQPTVPGGGQGGGGQGAGQGAVQGAGGRGGGQVQGVSTTAAPQVEAPVGGVGAGAGGLTLPLLGASLLSIAAGVARLRKLTNVPLA